MVDKTKRWKTAYRNEKDQDVVDILTEDEILEEYWEYWYGRMCLKFGEEYVNENFNSDDCISDWIVVNWAWEDKDENNSE